MENNKLSHQDKILNILQNMSKKNTQFSISFRQIGKLFTPSDFKGMIDTLLKLSGNHPIGENPIIDKNREPYCAGAKFVHSNLNVKDLPAKDKNYSNMYTELASCQWLYHMYMDNQQNDFEFQNVLGKVLQSTIEAFVQQYFIKLMRTAEFRKELKNIPNSTLLSVDDDTAESILQLSRTLCITVTQWRDLVKELSDARTALMEVQGSQENGESENAAQQELVDELEEKVANYPSLPPLEYLSSQGFLPKISDWNFNQGILKINIKSVGDIDRAIYKACEIMDVTPDIKQAAPQPVKTVIKKQGIKTDSSKSDKNQAKKKGN